MSESSLDNPAYADVDGEGVTLHYFNKTQDRIFELPCPVGTLRDMDEFAADIDVRYIERSRNPVTGRVSESMHLERVRCFLGLPSSHAAYCYEHGFKDKDHDYTHMAVILSEHAGVPYGTLLPIQFNGAEYPSVFRDDWEVASLRLHPAVEAYRAWHAEKRKQEQIKDAMDTLENPDARMG